jgi:hypothetical protein
MSQYVPPSQLLKVALILCGVGAVLLWAALTLEEYLP